MSEPRIYIAGPMTGIKWFNFPAFDAARDTFELHGWEPVSPADLDRANGFDAMALPVDTDWKNPEVLGIDIDKVIIRCVVALLTCEAIALLKGWQQSPGATAELALARWRKMRVIFWEPAEPMNTIRKKP